MNEAGELIVAQATADGTAGIGVLRLSGGARAIAGLAFSLLGGLPPAREARLSKLCARTGELLDEGLVLYFPAPASYTGEHVLELHTHGSRPILGALIDECLALGARLARPGEFTERAFLNGKLDLLQAEAVADLIAATDRESAQAALRVLRGQATARIVDLQQDLLDLRAEAEARIDFVDDLIEARLSPAWHADIHRLSARLQAVVAALEGERNRPLLPRVVLVGPPNAGKSTLFNALLAQERAIVSSRAGTTRDTLEEPLSLGHRAVCLIDTAGLHQSEDALEREGMARTRAALTQADAVLLLHSSDTCWDAGLEAQVLAEIPAASIIRVRTKCDADPAADGAQDRSAVHPVSAHSGAGLRALRERLLALRSSPRADDTLGLRSERHLAHLRQASAATERARELAGEDLVLVAEHLREAHTALSTLSGQQDISEDVLGSIFGRFCIGK